MNHSCIDTEHILLGLVQVDGLAAHTLTQLGVSLDAVRDEVEEIIGVNGTAPLGSPPFTSRAKHVLELSVDEAMRLGHSYVSTVHLLLGLVREGEGVAAQVLVSLGVDLVRLRQMVFELLAGYKRPESREVPQWVEAVAPRITRVTGCSFCGVGHQRPGDSSQVRMRTSASTASADGPVGPLRTVASGTSGHPVPSQKNESDDVLTITHERRTVRRRQLGDLTSVDG